MGLTGLYSPSMGTKSKKQPWSPVAMGIRRLHAHDGRKAEDEAAQAEPQSLPQAGHNQEPVPTTMTPDILVDALARIFAEEATKLARGQGP